MQHKLLSVLAKSTLGLALAVVAASSFAQAKKEVTFAHQDMVFPYRTVMESGELEKTTGYKINWRMFGGGGDVIKAMASGDVQIGEVGSSPLAAAASGLEPTSPICTSPDAMALMTSPPPPNMRQLIL